MYDMKLFCLFSIALCIFYSVSAQPEDHGDYDDSRSDPEPRHSAPEQSYPSRSHNAGEPSHPGLLHAPAPHFQNHRGQGHAPPNNFGSFLSANRPHNAPSSNRLAVPLPPIHHLFPYASSNPLGQHPPHGQQAPLHQNRGVHPQVPTDQRQLSPVFGHRNYAQQVDTDESHSPHSNHEAHAPPDSPKSQGTSLLNILKPTQRNQN